MNNKPPEFQRTPPQALEIEGTVLGAMMLDETALNTGMELLLPEYFYKTANRQIFEAIGKLFKESKKVDILTVPERLKEMGSLEESGGNYYISQLADMVSSPAIMSHYIGILREKSNLRELITTATNTIDASYGASAQYSRIIGEHLSDVDRINAGALKSRMVKFDQAVEVAIDDIADKKENPKSKSLLKTGFKSLDDIIDINAGDFMVLAARPSMGKTALALNIARNIIKQGSSVGIMSLEMTTLSLTHRIISAETNIDSKRIKNGQLSNEEMDKVRKISEKIYEWPMYIDDTPGLDINQIRSKAKIMMMWEIDFLIYDYLQISKKPKAQSTNDAIGELSLTFQSLAKELNIPVLVLSQLSREVEKRKNKEPQLSDLRDSGTLEQDPDTIVFIHRPWVYDSKNDPDLEYSGITKVCIAKQRNGPTGRCELNFVREYTSFYDIAYYEEGEKPF